MTKIIFRSARAGDVTLDVEPGVTLMQAAANAGLEGIVADCGGQCQCATCHVYVDDSYAQFLPPMSEDEDDMLEATASERTSRSRLSCQLVVDDNVDELVVDLPEHQR
jgi:ferredoxin, 2Fe-2S